MVWFMSRKETRDYAPDSGVLDMTRDQEHSMMEFADPDIVHARSKKDNVNKRDQGYALKPETLPKRYLWASDDLDEILPGFVVSPRFRDFVETFEPGVHQFVPVEIYRKPDGAPVATYYWFIVCQRIDSVDREHTTYLWDPNGDEPGYERWLSEVLDITTFEFTPVPNAKLVFNNEQVGSHHIWHDPYLLTFANGLCSDAFAKAALEQNFTGFDAVPRESVGGAVGDAAHG